VRNKKYSLNNTNIDDEINNYIETIIFPHGYYKNVELSIKEKIENINEIFLIIPDKLDQLKKDITENVNSAYDICKVEIIYEKIKYLILDDNKTSIKKDILDILNNDENRRMNMKDLEPIITKLIKVKSYNPLINFINMCRSDIHIGRGNNYPDDVTANGVSDMNTNVPGNNDDDDDDDDDDGDGDGDGYGNNYSKIKRKKEYGFDLYKKKYIKPNNSKTPDNNVMKKSKLIKVNIDKYLEKIYKPYNKPDNFDENTSKEIIKFINEYDINNEYAINKSAIKNFLTNIRRIYDKNDKKIYDFNDTAATIIILYISTLLNSHYINNDNWQSFDEKEPAPAKEPATGGNKKPRKTNKKLRQHPRRKTNKKHTIRGGRRVRATNKKRGKQSPFNARRRTVSR
jgi:hypothetical protein